MTILGLLDPPAADQNALSQNAQSRSQMTFYEFIKLEWSILKTVKEFNPEFAIEINQRMVIFIRRELDVMRRFY